MQPHRSRPRRFLLAMCLSAALALLYLRANPTAQQTAAVTPGDYHVVRDIDGDTIVVENQGFKDTVRLIGADTPEEVDPRKPVQCYAKQAAAFTANLVTGKTVRLEPDPEDSNRDKYGRLLRYVYLPDGTMLNAKLIAQGDAFAYKVFQFSRLDQFTQLEAQAKSQKLGLWGACQVDSGQLIEQTNSLN